MTYSLVEIAKAASDLSKACCFPKCPKDAEYAAVFYGKSCNCPVLVCDEHRLLCLAQKNSLKAKWNCTVCDDKGWELVGFAAI